VKISSSHLFRNADVPELASSLREARAAIENAFSLYEPTLAEQNFRVPQIPIVNLPVWELGHVAWFQERWLARNSELSLGLRCNPAAPLSASILSGADQLFDSSAVDHGTRWGLPLPSLDTTRTYAAAVLNQSLALLLEQGASNASHYLFWLTAAHEFMHAEAFSYMANTLDLAGAPHFRKESFQKTKLLYGVENFPRQATLFAFDNESTEQLTQADLEAPEALELDSFPVSWEMLREFRTSPRYLDDKYWLGQGKVWKNAIPLDEDDAGSAAAHVSYWEARAWCLWRGRALPTEAQWLAAVAAGNLPWGQVWEWTCSEFSPFSGFVTHPYQDYSQPWFNKGFQVLKGGSIYTHERMKHPLYRNFFLPSRDDVCTGFRSCKDLTNRLDKRWVNLG
jgi:gamma-glutamyl hercynylcysteine S-oxide synthase